MRRHVPAIRDLGGRVTAEPAGPVCLHKLLDKEYFVHVDTCSFASVAIRDGDLETSRLWRT
jgi:hypothetical protein